MKIETWPKTLYARTRYWNPDGKLGLFMGTQNTALHLTRDEKQETVEYTRAGAINQRELTQRTEDQFILEVLCRAYENTNPKKHYEDAAKAIDFLKRRSE